MPDGFSGSFLITAIDFHHYIGDLMANPGGIAATTESTPPLKATRTFGRIIAFIIILDI
ncbi:hypothetical protein DGWBC_0016 [Dehalogenimonas sp. WBC-2]|nr:hypothetical protein DGWBC_0016 [Dehalogenimonas sp. WBC-2]